MSSQSNVGNSQTYGNDDQRPTGAENDATRFEEGKEHSHNPLDSSMSFLLDLS